MICLGAGAPLVWFGSTASGTTAPPTTAIVATDKNAMRMTIFFYEPAISGQAAEQ
jgi:hypothetical protein